MKISRPSAVGLVFPLQGAQAFPFVSRLVGAEPSGLGRAKMASFIHWTDTERVTGGPSRRRSSGSCRAG